MYSDKYSQRMRLVYNVKEYNAFKKPIKKRNISYNVQKERNLEKYQNSNPNLSKRKNNNGIHWNLELANALEQIMI